MWEYNSILRKCIIENKIKILSNVKDGDFTKVYYVRSHNENLYLKICRTPLNVEGAIYNMLSKDYLDIFPKIYSLNMVKDCCYILMEDVGQLTLKSYGSNYEFILQSLMLIIALQEKCQDNFEVFEQQNIKRRYGDSIKEYILKIIMNCIYIEKSMKEKLMTLFTNILIAEYPLTIVHGDLYFDNLIINENGIRIIDWGFAHIGIGSLDAATLFSNHKKNGNNKISFEQKIRLYNEAYFRLFGKKMQQEYLQKYLALGYVLEHVFFISWIGYRIKEGLWVTNTQEQLINDSCNQILKYINYLK